MCDALDRIALAGILLDATTQETRAAKIARQREIASRHEVSEVRQELYEAGFLEVLPSARRQIGRRQPCRWVPTEHVCCQ